MDVDFDGVAGGAGLDDATLTTFALTNLTLNAGAGGVGVTIGPAGTLAIAIIKPKAPTAPAADSRSWLAVTGKNLQLSMTLPGITGTVVSGTVNINKASGAFDPTPGNPASGDETPASPLNWASNAATQTPLTVDLDPAGGWTAPTAFVDPGQALPTPDLVPIKLRGDVVSIGGRLANIDLFGLVTGSANFAITEQDGRRRLRRLRHDRDRPRRPPRRRQADADRADRPPDERRQRDARAGDHRRLRSASRWCRPRRSRPPPGPTPARGRRSPPAPSPSRRACPVSPAR